MVFNFGLEFEKAESYSITKLGQGKKLFVDEACRILNLGTCSWNSAFWCYHSVHMELVLCTFYLN